MGELWDVYDINKQKIGKLAERDVYQFEKGEFHIAVHAVILNSKNEILISKRAPTKNMFPELWEINGGSILAGETSCQGIIRELKEELGIILKEEEAVFYKTVVSTKKCPTLKDYWCFRKSIPIEEIKFTDNEATEAKWVTWKEYEKMRKKGEIVPTISFDEDDYKKIIELLKK